MDYLRLNLNKNLILSYDVMIYILYFLDPLFIIRQKIFNQIKKKDYNLDEIMYNRNKKYILKTYEFKTYNYFIDEDITGLNYGDFFIFSKKIMVTRDILSDLKYRHLIIKDYKLKQLKQL